MPFGHDLVTSFRTEVAKCGGTIDEKALFEALINAVCEAASSNGYAAHTQKIHKSYINFTEMAGVRFYYATDIGECVSCELADIMFIVYNQNEARLCFMQNKYDKRLCRNRDFRADTRQLYVLKHRPEYWKGRKHRAGTSAENILCTARYNSITNYGVFAGDNNSGYDMEYYNADTIVSPTGTGRSYVAKFDGYYPLYSTIDDPNDQLNYAFTLLDFGQGLANMKIGEKYETLDALLKAVNCKELIDYFQKINAANVEYDMRKRTVSARCAVIIEFRQEQNN